jgi:hypothetical protein
MARRQGARNDLSRPFNLILFAEQSVDDLSCGFADDATRASVALRHRRHEGASLFESDMRRERRHFRIGLYFLDDWSVAGKRFLPRGPQIARTGT